jgi:hypothetical protein
MIEKWLNLDCHSSTRGTVAGAVSTIRGLASRTANGQLQVTFRLDGELSRIRVPSPGLARTNTELWRHTCFEAFIAAAGQAAYHELNFAPSGEWCIYAFRDYRDGGPLADETLRPRIDVRSTDRQLELDALIRLDILSANHPVVPLRIGLSAVIETSDGLSYWALRHPGPKPDFHNADGFVLRLDLPGR